MNPYRWLLGAWIITLIFAVISGFYFLDSRSWYDAAMFALTLLLGVGGVLGALLLILLTINYLDDRARSWDRMS